MKKTADMTEYMRNWYRVNKKRLRKQRLEKQKKEAAGKRTSSSGKLTAKKKNKKKISTVVAYVGDEMPPEEDEDVWEIVDDLGLFERSDFAMIQEELGSLEEFEASVLKNMMARRMEEIEEEEM